MTNSWAEVAIVYRFLPQWRADFFCRLRESLESHKIRLRLFYGKNPPSVRTSTAPHRLKWGDEVDLQWGMPISNRLWNLGKYELVWQRLPQSVFNADLLVLMQENSLISNYSAGLRRIIQSKKTALWGHGINHQEDRHSIANTFKCLWSTQVDWWFAYTSSVAEELRRLRYPAERITIVNNAIDTTALKEEAQKVQPARLSRLRAELGIGKGPVGIFCGGMYPDKQLPFLIRACEIVRSQVPGFEVLFLGTGVDAAVVQRYADTNNWAHYIGPKYGADRVPYFMLSDVFLMPGVVGLAILDCFALETPLVTTNNPHHGPEIGYLEPGISGIISDNSLAAYVGAVVQVLRSEDLLSLLKRGCRNSSTQYTVEKMVASFSEGVQNALASSRWPGTRCGS
jgi:glycosyltransferase involved in cell wall biosynthesis